MYIEFDQDYLRELYETGKTSDKKHRFQPQVIRGYQKAVFRLRAASCIEKLYHLNALNFEALVGDKQGMFSVRANGKYRVEFTVREEHSTGAQFITICRILELSNHYK